MRKILITNDDGIFSERMHRLIKLAQKFGEVWVVAPESERSAASHSISLRTPVRLKKIDLLIDGVRAYSCSGTPADCVRIGVLNVVPNKPDVVFSGINCGYNVASDLQYSATVGAAFEGAFQGITSIAISEDMDDKHEIADLYLEDILKELIDTQLPKNKIWNVNIPTGNATSCKGVLYDRVPSKELIYEDYYDETVISDDETEYMVHGIERFYAEEGSDLKAIRDGYISVGVVENLF